MASYTFKNIYLNDYFTMVGPLEKNSHLKNYNMALKDYYDGEKTFEQAEIKMQKTVIEEILKRNNLTESNIDLSLGGDLINQISITSYSLKDFSFPHLGLYSACATFIESLIIGSVFLEQSNVHNVLAFTSSHNLTSERQFRYPVEYGSPKKKTSTFTATGAICTYLSNKDSKIKIESGTIGQVIDMGIDDEANMGAVMAPAAAQVLQMHLLEMKRELDYYDLILTGDLGCVGATIFKEYLKRSYNLKIKNHKDAGCELYLDSQDTYAGGSGPICLPLVFFDQILPKKKYHKILLIGTGSLQSPVLVNQHKTIPAIAHAISLEVL